MVTYVLLRFQNLEMLLVGVPELHVGEYFDAHIHNCGWNVAFEMALV